MRRTRHTGTARSFGKSSHDLLRERVLSDCFFREGKNPSVTRQALAGQAIAVNTRRDRTEL